MPRPAAAIVHRLLQRPDRPTARGAVRVAPWALVAALAAVLVVRAPRIIAAMHADADLVAPIAMARLLHGLPGSAAMTGNYGWWNGLWASQALQPLPGSALLATWIPLLLTVGAIAALTVQAARLFGGAAAVAVPLLAGSVGVTTWVMNASWSGRAPTWWGMVALGIFLVLHAGGHRSRWATAGGAVVVLWCAAALSGDALAWVAIVLPAAGTGVLARIARRPTAAVAVPLIAAGAIAALSVGIRAIAGARGYAKQESPIELVPYDAVRPGVDNAAVGLQEVWEGTISTGLHAVSGLVGLAVVALGLVVGVALVASGTGVARRTSVRPMLRRGVDVRPDPEDARRAWVAFWTTAGLGMIAAFVVSGSTFDVDGPVARYLYGVPFAVAALAAAVAHHRRARSAVLALVSVLALLAAVHAVSDPPERIAVARAPLLPAVEAAARAEGVSRGYSGYWSSYPMTVRSGFRLRVAPVGECPGPSGRSLCPMFLHYVDRAYDPVPGVRSFLLVDDEAPARLGPGEWVTRPPDGLVPVATRQIGPHMRMLVYDHDIAADLQDRTTTSEPLRHRD